MVYKQIAGEMQLSVLTIRTHLHNVYRKIGAADRAQAVLTARDRGWIYAESIRDRAGRSRPRGPGSWRPAGPARP